MSDGTTLLGAGSRAPTFRAAASDGNTYDLTELLGEGHVVLVFYPGNDTPG